MPRTRRYASNCAHFLATGTCEKGDNNNEQKLTRKIVEAERSKMEGQRRGSKEGSGAVTVLKERILCLGRWELCLHRSGTRLTPRHELSDIKGAWPGRASHPHISVPRARPLARSHSAGWLATPYISGCERERTSERERGRFSLLCSSGSLSARFD
jgi:hypothetical protein